MQLLNYQARQLIQRFNIPVASFGVVTTASEAKNILEVLRNDIIVKAETYGVGEYFFTSSQKEALQIVKNMLNNGVNKISLTQAVNIKYKYFIHFAVNSAGLLNCTIFFDKNSLSIVIDTQDTIYDFHVTKISKFLGWNKEQAHIGCDIIKALIQLYMYYDVTSLGTMFALDVNNRFCVLDATIFIDSRALYRQEALARSFDASYMSQHAISAWHFDLDYIEYNGTIGTIVNGKDSAATTLDLLHMCGKYPASIIDLGSDITKDILGSAMQILNSHSQVKMLFLNIFAGFMNCKLLSEVILDIVDKFKIDAPIIVRLEGVLCKEGYKILHNSTKNVIPVYNLKDAMKKFVAMK